MANCAEAAENAEPDTSRPINYGIVLLAVQDKPLRGGCAILDSRCARRLAKFVAGTGKRLSTEQESDHF